MSVNRTQGSWRIPNLRSTPTWEWPAPSRTTSLITGVASGVIAQDLPAISAGKSFPSAANPKFALHYRESACELGVQSGTRIIECQCPSIPKFASVVLQGWANLGIEGH